MWVRVNWWRRLISTLKGLHGIGCVVGSHRGRSRAALLFVGIDLRGSLGIYHDRGMRGTLSANKQKTYNWSSEEYGRVETS